MDKRIDVLATAMYADITALQLKELDLSYAPPYSSAKDPVNMAGFMIENLSHGLVEQFFPEDVDAPAPGRQCDAAGRADPRRVRRRPRGGLC